MLSKINLTKSTVTRERKKGQNNIEQYIQGKPTEIRQKVHNLRMAITHKKTLTSDRCVLTSREERREIWRMRQRSGLSYSPGRNPSIQHCSVYKFLDGIFAIIPTKMDRSKLNMN